MLRSVIAMGADGHEPMDEDRPEEVKPEVRPAYEGFSPEYLKIYYGM
jgi:hypothetical protein